MAEPMPPGTGGNAPWYRRAWGRYRTWPKWAQIAVAVLAVVVIVGPFAGGQDDNTTGVVSEAPVTTTAALSTAGPPTTVASTTAAPVATAPPTTAPGVNYAGRQKDDRLAGGDGSVQLSGYTTTVTNLARTSDPLSRKLICGEVTIRNRDSKAQRYSMFDFRLQTPAGDVRDATITTTTPLDSGDLIAGGTKTGNVCWEDPGQAGQYVVIWKPDAFNADRGIWLVTL